MIFLDVEALFGTLNIFHLLSEQRRLHQTSMRVLCSCHSNEAFGEGAWQAAAVSLGASPGRWRSAQVPGGEGQSSRGWLCLMRGSP